MRLNKYIPVYEFSYMKYISAQNITGRLVNQTNCKTMFT